MSRKNQSQNVIPKIWLRVVSAALALAMVLVFGVVIAPSAQAQTFKVLYKFQGPPDGSGPEGGLVAFGGRLYGITNKGGTGSPACRGYGCGTVFSLDKTSGAETVLYSFRRLGQYGAYPSSGLLGNGAGKFYGTTQSGGIDDLGIVFKINTSGVESALYAFTGASDGDGAYPSSNLIGDSSGNLYGTTIQGGDSSCDGGYGCGTVFKLDTGRKVTVFHAFTGPPDGAFPYAGLVRDAAGNLYGTTSSGGSTNATCAPAGGCGTVFKIDITGKETVLYTFTGAPDGENPGGGLILDAAGNLYGITGGGGEAEGQGNCTDGIGCGTVFKLDAATGKETILYTFAGGTDGSSPEAGVIRDAAGNIYGTTGGGGSSNPKCITGTCGTVFELDATGKETILHRFVGTDGELPLGTLLRDKAGNLYGTTLIGTRDAKNGVVFEVTP